MKTYYFKFYGHYPVGACGVVKAETKGEAYALAYDEVVKINKDNHGEFMIDKLIEIPEGCTIVLNGDY